MPTLLIKNIKDEGGRVKGKLFREECQLIHVGLLELEN